MRRLNRALRRRPPPCGMLRPVLAAVALGLPVAALGYGAGAAVGSGMVAALGARAVDELLRLSAAAGLRVQTVYGEGLVRTRRDELAAGAAIPVGQPILALDLEAVRAGVERLTWIDSATVARSLPDTVTIRVVERRPLALWQRDDGFELVDRRGEVIRVDAIERFRDLPVLVGDEAPSRAAELFAVVSTAPELLGRIRAAILVGGRRWDVQLDNGVRVRLPERDAEAAWRLVATRLRRDGLLEPPTLIVDLRLPDRMVVRRRLGEDDQSEDGLGHQMGEERA
jgi:cell division protein FtsQ